LKKGNKKRLLVYLLEITYNKKNRNYQSKNPSASSVEVIILEVCDKMKGPNKMVRVNIWQFRGLVRLRNSRRYISICSTTSCIMFRSRWTALNVSSLFFLEYLGELHIIVLTRLNGWWLYTMQSTSCSRQVVWHDKIN
jgi:hypothetical protein